MSEKDPVEIIEGWRIGSIYETHEKEVFDVIYISPINREVHCLAQNGTLHIFDFSGYVKCEGCTHGALKRNITTSKKRRGYNG
jgi:hypothetical protein